MNRNSFGRRDFIKKAVAIGVVPVLPNIADNHAPEETLKHGKPYLKASGEKRRLVLCNDGTD